MKSGWKRLTALALTGTLISGLCVTASAFTFPSAYWPLQAAWEEAVSTQNMDQTISVAQQTYELYQGQALCKEICEILEPYCSRAAWCYEIRGDLDNAILWRERQLMYAQWLNDNIRSYQDTLINVNAQLNHLNTDMAIYALVDDPADVPYYGSVGEPVSGVYYGTVASGTHVDDSAALIYVTFGDSYGMKYWLDYYAALDSVTDRALNSGGVVEVAWNFQESNSGLQTVLSSDAYISQSLAELGSRDCTVLLRIGAEMNCWTNLPDAQTYIQAYRKIAQEARRYDNIALVYSPNDVSNRTVDYETYYPGDNYVDWIGVSSYKRNAAGYGSAYTYSNTGYSNDAFYCTGIYGNDPLVVLEDLAQMAADHKKPMMISECGAAYYNSSTGAQQTEYAVDQLRKFYSYLPMVFPQIKAIFYFDVNHDTSDYDYALTGNAALASTYTGIVSQGAFLQWGEDEGAGYTELKTAIGKAGETKLSTYIIFPGSGSATCTYYLDGAVMATVSQEPFTCTLPSQLSAGVHTIEARAVRGSFSDSVKYTIYVDNGGSVYGADSLPLDLSSADPWATGLILSAYADNLVTERTDSDFRASITRLQFAELAVNLIEQATGSALSTGSQSFVDTSDPVALKAAQAGVASGKGEGRFAPNDPITRQEICVMLRQVIRCVDEANGTNTLTNQSTTVSPAFTDAGQIAPWATEHMALITNNGLMSGKGDGILAPLSNTTIQEAITLILALNNKF